MFDIRELQKNHTYLIKYGMQDTLSSITILLITEKAYRLRWGSGNETWETKEYLYRNYNVVEDISDFVVEQPDLKYCCIEQPHLQTTTKYVSCPNCGGTGQVQSFDTTAGTKTCPRCWGSKMIPDMMEVHQ